MLRRRNDIDSYNQQESFIIDNNEYQTIGRDTVLLNINKSKCKHFVIPAKVISPNGNEYKVSNVAVHFNGRKWQLAKTISFDKGTDMQVIPISLIFLSKSIFYFPPRIKRVITDVMLHIKWPKIILDYSNKFISVMRNNIIMNNHPLELLHEQMARSRLYIRETLRIVGKRSFMSNKYIKYISIPPSTEIISAHAFQACINLQYIKFAKNSKLKKIGRFAFKGASITKLNIPSSVELIDHYAFSSCKNLSYITIYIDSKLIGIGDNAFEKLNIKSIYFPKTLTIFGKHTFKSCKKLTKIKLANDSQLLVINRHSFIDTSLELIVTPTAEYFIGNTDFKRRNDLFDVTMVWNKEKKIPEFGKILEKSIK